MFRNALFAVATAALVSIAAPAVAVASHLPDAQAPAIVGNAWINSAPLSLEQLRGSVVLVEFWTYSCANCLRVLPHVSRWHELYAAQGLVVIGVHTPEFDFERAGVRVAVDRLGIRYPVVQDDDYRTWNAWGNQFWPALYLIDRRGRIVYHRFGEGDYARTEAEIRRQLSLPPL